MYFDSGLTKKNQAAIFKINNFKNQVAAVGYAHKISKQDQAFFVVLISAIFDNYMEEKLKESDAFKDYDVAKLNH